MTDRPNYAPEIRRALVDPRQICDALGLTAAGGRTVIRQARGLIVRCPKHEENTPSCSVRVAGDGTIAVKCFGCDWSSDVLGLVAAARGLDLRSDFRAVLVESAQLAGLWQVVDELEGRGVSEAHMARTATTLPQDAPEPPRTYPDNPDSFWGILERTAADPLVAEYLRSRAIDPERVDALELARALPPRGALPAWARCRGGDWREAGYRLVVPMHDHEGAIRSFRGWRVVKDDSGLPKRIPPSGHRASGLAMADPWGLAWLRGERDPRRITIVEGESDFAVWATRLNDPGTAVIGIVSGSWSQQFADKVPVGCRVDVRTDCDEAGDRYAREIERSLRRRAFVYWTRRVA